MIHMKQGRLALAYTRPDKDHLHIIGVFDDEDILASVIKEGHQSGEIPQDIGGSDPARPTCMVVCIQLNQLENLEIMVPSPPETVAVEA